MATIDRFKEMLKTGCLPSEQGGGSLTAQTKYDFLAAVHTMEQIENLAATLKKRAQKRSSLKEKLLAHSVEALNKLTAKEESLTVKDIDGAIKILIACRSELLPLEGEERADKALGKLIADGVSAGR